MLADVVVNDKANVRPYVLDTVPANVLTKELANVLATWNQVCWLISKPLLQPIYSQFASNTFANGIASVLASVLAHELANFKTNDAACVIANMY